MASSASPESLATAQVRPSPLAADGLTTTLPTMKIGAAPEARAPCSRALLTRRPIIAERRRQTQLPRLPLKGSIDLTYRCDNHCRHCWLWLAENAPEQRDELSTDEWREVIDQARALGTREWAISGGEPMLRPDFAEIFDYVTAKATTYSLNSNGTLITPEVAQLLRRKGSKMIAVYGATAAVYDEVTRNPGGFEALMEGFARLKEAGAGFTVQLIPMKGNWHEWAAMQDLARSLSKHWRVGAPWLYMSACAGEARNAEIAAQRLDPADAVALDEPDLSGDEPAAALAPPVADAARLRYALTEAFPRLRETRATNPEYLRRCAVCFLKGLCEQCPAKSWAESGTLDAPVEYLCEVAHEQARHLGLLERGESARLVTDRKARVERI